MLIENEVKKVLKKQHVLRCYLAGAMENRRYEDIKYEHFYVRSQLGTLGIEIFDPLIKEDHKPGKSVGLKSCGLKPKDVYYQDLGAVERADIVFWITGDIQSEGSLTEVAWAGCWNRLKQKPLKIIVVVSPKRFSGDLVHFAGMHEGVKIVKSVEDGIQYLRKVLKR